MRAVLLSLAAAVLALLLFIGPHPLRRPPCPGVGVRCRFSSGNWAVPHLPRGALSERCPGRIPGGRDLGEHLGRGRPHAQAQAAVSFPSWQTRLGWATIGLDISE